VVARLTKEDLDITIQSVTESHNNVMREREEAGKKMPRHKGKKKKRFQASVLDVSR
jgi:hypothetical protein